ncbi:hypothetical protein HCU64_14675 [Methylobacterium sp. C25]|uniref:hypothetical protein n=1 Tax=Methylobacterium sp. C25 TaxID=2721622 RepID=UPI001F1BAC1D|nr:hypothetical protein [Methylobacterium sp. C25]MCE4225003.1 hypothetical protein [Methylobacterium sp. C25]
MNTTIRFGKKISLPPTSIIKHQLRMMAAADSLVVSLLDVNLNSHDKTIALAKLFEDYKMPVDKSNIIMHKLRFDHQNV